ncbi:MAG: hypothetical protein QW407_03805 [Thermofilaceae archaeon]
MLARVAAWNGTAPSCSVLHTSNHRAAFSSSLVFAIPARAESSTSNAAFASTSVVSAGLRQVKAKLPSLAMSAIALAVRTIDAAASSSALKPLYSSCMDVCGISWTLPGLTMRSSAGIGGLGNCGGAGSSPVQPPSSSPYRESLILWGALKPR